MESNTSETEWQKLPYGQWMETHVSAWLKFIGIKANYIEKLEEEKVTGPVLMSLHKAYLRAAIEMKGGQIELLLQKRDQLLQSEPNALETDRTSCHSAVKEAKSVSPSRQDSKPHPQKHCKLTEKEDINVGISEKLRKTLPPLCRYRNFDEDDKDFRYVKHNVLSPETGVHNMIIPCHEYKSLEIAHKLDSKRLQTKVAKEVLRFACACMNMRTNGTIHFGIMDKVSNSHQHGEIIGIPIENREDFVDALDYIERCFEGSNKQIDARRCIKNPKFIEVVDKDPTEKTWVIEYDVVPKASIVKDKFYRVGVPNFNEKDGKIKLDQKAIYQRKGANTTRILEGAEEFVHFIQELKESDSQREQAECYISQTTLDCRDDQKRKLPILLTCGKKYMDNSLFYIIVTNKFNPEHLENTDFLIHMNLFCVFDFDPDSKTTGLCGRYKEHHAANLHFLQDYANDGRLSTKDFTTHLQLFDRTSWIFCNGRKDFYGGEETCNEKTWIKTRKKKLKKAISIICNDILPKHSFVVLFLLMSHVEQPLVETFHEFYAEMNGHDGLAVISESLENYNKWSSHAQVSCNMSTLNEISIVEMPLSHVDATVQSIQLSENRPTRRLPVINKGLCFLKSVEEDMMNSLDVVCVDQCEDKKLEIMNYDEIEKYFYKGGKIDWTHFWLADKRKCGEIIQRDAYKDTKRILEDIVHRSKAIRSIESVNVYHEPGSGGSTVARQILWNWRTKVRCAVVKQSNDVTTVCEHALRLREHEEKDKNHCLPVLLLLEDCNADYIDELRRELSNVISTKKLSPSVLCFILLICKRTHDPGKMCRASPSQTVAVTHKLTNEEKALFSKKLEQLKLEYKPVFILTFVLMSNEFNEEYIKNWVDKIFLNIDHSSITTRLIRFVALLNCYIPDSFISVSHCEVALGIQMYVERVRDHAFVECLSEEARFLFIHLREDSNLSSIRIIHPLVAKVILIQLSAKISQSDITMNLINDKSLINHRFSRDAFLSFIRALFIRRNKTSRGDTKDTTLSPLVEHVCEKDGVQKAVDLMKAAYISLGKDAYVAQQLARLLYTNLRFEEAQEWAETAREVLPLDTFVLDTLGQVYKRWFYHLYDKLETKEKTPVEGIEIISTALKGISVFQDSVKTPKKETVSLNSSYYGEVDVGCRLLKFLSEVNVFSTNRPERNSELMKYLLTEYIPEDIKNPWQSFHHQLKAMPKCLQNALECISEDLSYFQTAIGEEEEELDAREPEQIHNPRRWLRRKSAEYAMFFCNISDGGDHMNADIAFPAEKVTPLQRQMRTWQLGAGNITSILTLLYDDKKAGPKLETVIGLYPESMNKYNLDQAELANYIFCQIALHCIVPGSSYLLPLQKLQELSKRFNTKTDTSASVCFLLLLLFWPESNEELSSANSNILVSATDSLHRLGEKKIQHANRKNRTVTHFFLAKARGLNKIVHRSAIEKHIKGTLTEINLKWREGEVWKTKEVAQLLKRVEGWTENGKMFVRVQGATRENRIRVFPRYSASLPHANENITFYLGFSFNGVFAFDIQIME